MRAFKKKKLVIFQIHRINREYKKECKKTYNLLAYKIVAAW